MPDKEWETDVLIIGAGGAGLRAALEAREHGADVLVLSKGVAGRSGSTPTALTGYQAAFGHADSADSPRVHYEDTLRNGRYLSDPRLARILAQEAPASVLDLERLGVRFQKTADGRFVQKRLDDSQSYPRSVRAGDTLGLSIMAALRRAARVRGVRLMSDVFITRLAVEGGRAVGAVGLDLHTGGTVSVRAGAVVLATGGAGELYALSSNPPEATGDGYLLAYREGAELVDMEFFLFVGHAVLHPRSARGVLYPFQYLLELGARHLYNARGETFIGRYTPDGSVNPSRDRYARAIHWEVRAGRGSEHGGAYFDPASLPHEVLERELPTQTRFLEAVGGDTRAPLELGVASHFLCGGVVIDEDCRTRIDGLFAVGETAGGVHGGARIGGNALAELFVFGRRAGRAAAGAARSAVRGRGENLLRDLAGRERRRLDVFLKRRGGPRPAEVKRRLQRLMWDNVSVVRNGDDLARALTEVRALRDAVAGAAPASADPRCNLDILAALELDFLTELAEIVTLASLTREESRAAHFREDFPAERPEWRVNLLSTRGPDGPVLTRRAALAADPVPAGAVDPAEVVA